MEEKKTSPDLVLNKKIVDSQKSYNKLMEQISNQESEIKHLEDLLQEKKQRRKMSKTTNQKSINNVWDQNNSPR